MYFLYSFSEIEFTKFINGVRILNFFMSTNVEWKKIVTNSFYDIINWMYSVVSLIYSLNGFKMFYGN